MACWAFLSSAEAETERLGKQLGRLLQQPALILLQGELGTGKSVFARGVARGLGVDAAIPITSPTFTLMNHYSARLELYHFDLYRLSSPDELQELGFDDYAYGSGVALVEWPEKLDNPETPGLWVRLARESEAQRRVEFTAQGGEAEPLLAALRKACDKAAVGKKGPSEKAFDRL